ncbi:MAG: phage major capsid protein [Clostridium sp.]
MPKELLELLNKIKAKKEVAANLLNEKKLDEAEKVTKEIKDMQKEFEIKASLFEDTRDNLPIEGTENKTSKDLGIILAKAITGRATPEEVKNLMQENTPEGSPDKGAVTVPKDVKTRIMELQRKSFDVRKYINIEPVGTNKGSRPIEANEPEATGFASVDEGADIQALHEPEFDELEYVIRKYAGYIPLTNELLEDSDENMLAYIEKWMAKNELNTYNYQVFNGTGSKSAQGIMTAEGLNEESMDTVPTIKKFKSIINKDLEDIDSDNIVIFTNAHGYDYLDGLEDANKKPYLQPDVTKASGYTFLGKEIVKVPSKFLANVVGGDAVERTPFIIGDLKLLYTMFDRKSMSIESTKIGGNAWRQDKTEVKGIFRFDGKLVDKKAVKLLLAKLA